MCLPPCAQQEFLDFPQEPNQSTGTPEQAEGSSSSPTPLRRRFKRGGGNGRDSSSDATVPQKSGFTMWTLHEDTSKPLSVVPTTAMTVVDTYVVTVAKMFPDDAAVQVSCVENCSPVCVSVCLCVFSAVPALLLLLLLSRRFCL